MRQKYRFDLKNSKKFTLNFNADLLEKFKTIAKKDMRSTNRQLFMLVRDCVVEYENEHGDIET